MSRFNNNNIQQPSLEKIIEDLENETYMSKSFADNFKEDVVSRIGEFSSWFNSVARLYIYKCDMKESEVLLYLLQNLKKSLGHAMTDINEATVKKSQCYTCICNEQIQIEPYQNVWKGLQNHLHFEENYNYAITNKCFIENRRSSAGDIVEPFSRVSISEPIVSQHFPSKDLKLNNFRFNFVVKYDDIVYEHFYPSALVKAARSIDNLREMSVQRCGVNRGSCLVCCCSLTSKGRARSPKITPFIVKNHAMGQKHISNASSKSHIEGLQNYHSFWRGQETCYQAHQSYFVPEPPYPEICRCHLCLAVLAYHEVLDHIKGAVHKKAVLEMFNTAEGKSNDFYLMDIQLQVYDIFLSDTNASENSSKRETNGTDKASCNIVKCVIDPEALSLPPRFSDHLRLLQRGQSIVHCKACNTNIIDDFFCIRRHIVCPIHQEKSKIYYKKFNYFCDFCSFHIKGERGWLDHFQKGPNKHDACVKDRIEIAAEYECRTCFLVIFGDETSIKNHIATKYSKEGRMKDIRLPAAVKILLESRKGIKEEAQKLQSEAITVLQQHHRTFGCCRSLERALGKIYANCKAYPFGSRMSGLANQQSDLDVFIDMGGMYRGNKFQEPVCQEDFVRNASKIFKSFKDFLNVFPIPSARTPIVKLHEIYGNLDCDISFRHGLGVENTNYLTLCIQLQPMTQSFILLLKRWSLCSGLNEHITNYSLAIMAVFYLQVKGHLPSVIMIRKSNPSIPMIIDGWETFSYPIPKEHIQNLLTPISKDICELLQDFFFYFSEFDYANEVVCPLLGKTVPKFHFNEKPSENLPPEMELYVKRIKNPNAEPFRGLSPFCVQDPFDLSHNLTKACQPHVINKLKTYCKLSYDLLKTLK